MRAYHNTRDTQYRSPYGALPLGEQVTLSLDVWDAAEAQCVCRVWIDGSGETLLPMERTRLPDRERHTCVFRPAEPAIVWYRFLIRRGEEVRHYGAREGAVGGEGAVWDWEPPSFQITAYRERKVPDWYKSAVVYQIFPDRYARGEDWRERAEAALAAPRKGPARAVCEDWYAPPRYEKTPDGRIARWDFYGGTLSGIREKLPELRAMGITVLYLNPIFEAASNHRYDTGDYCRLDPMLGGPGDFADFCRAARAHGIRVILDGVFNHTGCDSRYFNKYGNYPEAGAWQDADSPYRDWFCFTEDGYDCWWGVDDLPDVDEHEPSYREFICGGGESVVRRWLREGASGWRLDVADELPDDFIAEIKSAALEETSEAVVIGEVWEDASNKISYGKLRRYFLGDELDSVMNYPLRDALLSFLTGAIPGWELRERLESLRENYPSEAFYAALNMMGSHDRPRLMTLLGGAPDAGSLSEAERAAYRLQEWQRGLAKGRLWLLTLCQMTLPGVPCVYYGDEAGLEGYADPYNRAAFPWGREDADTESIYRNAISLRKLLDGLFVGGSFETLAPEQEDVFGFLRRSGGEAAAVLVNRSASETHTVRIPALGEKAEELVSGQRVAVSEGGVLVTLYPMGSAVVYFGEKNRLGRPMPHGAGVLCHITSLPNEKGPGTVGEPAKRFIDFLARAGQRYWQLLPVNPTDEHGSPYAGVSAFAGNTALLDGGGDLRAAFAQFRPDADYRRFCEENRDWLDPYAAFMAIRDTQDGKKWQEWPEAYRTYTPALAEAPELSESIAYYQFCQYEFMRQWNAMRDHARENGVLLIGDMPMYVSEDSADAWAEPEQFLLDAQGYKTSCAGVPPDYFCEEGQLWGNPLYDWAAMERDGYGWWMRRLRRAFELYDFVRMDHFRGFAEYWAVPKGEKASAGQWLLGPGVRLFEKAYAEFGPLPIMAEDLGVITPGVRTLLAKCGFPGMDVLQFSDTDPREGYDPLPEKLAYTGTHDNQTILGWCAARYPEADAGAVAVELMTRVLRSPANVAILPLQDVLGLDDAARMNTPGTVGKNWQWQAFWKEFIGASVRLANMTNMSKRRGFQ